MRRVRRIAFAALLGILTTIVVGIGGYSFIGYPPGGRYPAQFTVRVPGSASGDLILVGWSSALGADQFLSVRIGLDEASGTASLDFDEVRRDLPRWCRDRVLHLEPDVPKMIRIEGRGWPFRAFHAEGRSDGMTWTEHGSLRMDRQRPWRRLHESVVPMAGKIMVPVRPLWGGFALDAAVFGLAWWVVLFSLASARRGLRHRRGRCIECGYDLRHDLASGCPECGWNRAHAPPPQ